MDFLDTLPPFTDEDRSFIAQALEDGESLPLPAEAYEKFNPLWEPELKTEIESSEK